jgi:hypothetical protein
MTVTWERLAELVERSVSHVMGHNGGDYRVVDAEKLLRLIREEAAKEREAAPLPGAVGCYVCGDWEHVGPCRSKKP